jgi:anti-anti-sigma factor
MNIFHRENVRQNTVITLGIQSLDSANAQRVTKSLAEAIRGESRVVVDLGALSYFDVSGFAALLKLAVHSNGGPEVRLCSGSGTIQALFELLGANSVVPLFQSRDEALASFGAQHLANGNGHIDTYSRRGEELLPG